MTLLTQPLREEHQELLPHIEQLRMAAESVGDVPVETLRQNIGAVYTFLTEHLIPHAQAEDQALYPVVAKVMGAPLSTATMRRDHVEVGRLTEELGALQAQLAGAALSDAHAKALRRVLYGLYALVMVHFAKEEEIYLPLLDAQLTADEAQRMFVAMDVAAHAAMYHAAG
jgi:iron-sulfur cluster repair protein YtfE (RIC family)